jgi:TP901 family phage tail tape measure protein
MTNLDLVVRVGASLAGLRNELRRGKQYLKDFSNEVQASAAKRQAIDDLGGAFGKVGLAAGLAAATSVKKFADFDEAISAVKATGEDAAASIDSLRQAALDAGAATKFNATESAQAIENLAKAGVSAKDILGGGLKGSLDLAAAGGLEVADAAEYASIAMTQFGLKGADVPHVADLMAAAAGKANGEVSDLGQALNQSGLVANQVGLSIEETTAGLAAFAQAGLLGSDAGTSLKTMLQRLTPQSKEAATAMKKYGVEAYDAAGNFVGLDEYAGRLREGLKGLSVEQRNSTLATIFGSDAVRAATVLYDNGASGIRKWEKATNDAGYAAKTASTRMDNLKGDWEQFTGALETALIGTGSGSNGPLRELVQNLTGLVDAYNELSPAMKSAVGNGLAVTAMLGTGAFVATKAITGYANLKNTLIDLGVSQDRFSRKQLAGRGALVAGGLALGAVADKASEANTGLGILASTGAGAAMGAFGGPWGMAIGGAAGALMGIVQATSKTSDSLDAGKTAVTDYASTFDTLTGAVTRSTQALAYQDLKKSGLLSTGARLGIADRDLVGYVTGNGAAQRRVQDQVGKQFWDLSSEDRARARELQDGLRKMTGDISAQSQAARDAIQATTDWKTALAGVPRDVRVKLANMNYEATLDEVIGLARQYNLTPKQVRTVLNALDYATGDIQTVMAALRRVPNSKTITLTTVERTIRESYQVPAKSDPKPSLRNMLNRAEGGEVAGPGNGTSDSIGAWLSNGEHVWTAKEVQAAGGQAAVYAMRKAVMRQRFAGGGAVGSSAGSAAPSPSTPQLVRIKSGALEIRGGQAYITSLAEVVVSERERFNDSNRRAGR